MLSIPVRNGQQEVTMYVPSVVSQLRPPMNILLCHTTAYHCIDAEGGGFEHGYRRADIDISTRYLEQEQLDQEEKNGRLYCA